MDAASDSHLTKLGNRYVAELFEYSPDSARAEGDHSYDGILGPVGAQATLGRIAQLDEMATELAAVTPRNAEARVDAITLRHRIASERFELVDLEAARRNPLSALFRGANPQPYCTHEYAPVPERAEGLARHLEQLPSWLDAAIDELDDGLDEGPRAIAIEVARRLAGFFADDIDAALPLPAHPELGARLRAAASGAAAACRHFATVIEGRGGRPTPPLGEERFIAMLYAQEGVTETIGHLRQVADAELAVLGAMFEDVAGRIAPGQGVGAAVARMEDDHPTADSLIDDAAVSLAGLRSFWRESGAITVPDDPCRVQASPPYLRWSSAMFDPPGSLAPPEVESNYIVTPVDDTMTDKQADEWLRSLNRWLLENVGVHEVYPGHFVHFLHARRQRSLVRRVGWAAGFGEGWAHYTEHLAIEHGLAEDRPLLHLAQLQDALLRACRFRATLMLHVEGGSVDDATALFMEHTGTHEFPSRREAERGTYDPMYLAYTYGKLQILGWRAHLEGRPGYSERAFHDTMVGSGTPPLAAVGELLLNGD